MFYFLYTNEIEDPIIIQDDVVHVLKVQNNPILKDTYCIFTVHQQLVPKET